MGFSVFFKLAIASFTFFVGYILINEVFLPNFTLKFIVLGFFPNIYFASAMTINVSVIAFHTTKYGHKSTPPPNNVADV